jgi:hypothetical protein
MGRERRVYRIDSREWSRRRRREEPGESVCRHVGPLEVLHREGLEFLQLRLQPL